ncbi:MAG TPA: hypothetical protein VN372_00195 [Methanospirillum sp.]|nr:hypothetical protein [Methanospirillum sp.]
MRTLIGLSLLLIILMTCAGCAGKDEPVILPAYTISDKGNLTFTVPAPTVGARVLRSSGNATVEELTLSTFAGDVSAVLVSPVHPLSATVWAPGAGVPATGHIDHLLSYAERGIAVLVLDIRGNGGKTPGYPLNLEQDYEKVTLGQWPQVFLIISDLIAGEDYLHKRYGHIPVWVVGESNGGRYAAIAAATDPDFTGYIGISTSGFDRLGDQYEGTARSFLWSIDPDVIAPGIGPRPSYIYHAPTDTVIPFEAGKKLAERIGDSANFSSFNGTHGVNGEVDSLILNQITRYHEDMV